MLSRHAGENAARSGRQTAASAANPAHVHAQVDMAGCCGANTATAWASRMPHRIGRPRMMGNERDEHVTS